MAVTEKFQHQLSAHVDLAAQFDITTVEKHRALSPLKFQTIMARRVEKPSKVSDEILATLQNTRKQRGKLSSVESQRLVMVYDETVKRSQLVLSILSVCSLNPEKFLARFSVQLGDDVAQLMLQHAELVRSASAYNPSDISSERCKVLQDSLRNILYRILKSPEVIPVFMTVDVMKGHSVQSRRLVSTLQGYRKEITLHIAENRKDEDERKRNIATLHQIQEGRQATIVELEADLKEQRDHFGAKVAEREQVLQEKSLKAIKMENAARSQARKFREDSEHEKERTSKEEIIAELKEKVAEGNGTAAALTQQHRGIELEQRKRNFRVESEVDTWIRKYDEEMGEKQAQFDELEAAHNAEKAQLDELTVRFNNISTLRAIILEERRLAAEKREQEEIELRRQVKASIYIQYMWRKFLQRRALNKKKKKKKGKGSGKKGKGRKKSGKK